MGVFSFFFVVCLLDCVWFCVLCVIFFFLSVVWYRILMLYLSCVDCVCVLVGVGA